MTEPREHDERVDVARSAACAEMDDDLPDAARVLREGGDLAGVYPDLAHHLEDCEWCRTTLDELVKEPEVPSEPEIELDASAAFDRDLAAALRAPEPIARIHAAERARESQRVGPAALEELARRAVEDPDQGVRAAAVNALDELDAAVWVAGAGVHGRLSAVEGELRLTLEGLPASFEATTPVVAVPEGLRATAPEVEWYGKEPGLVTAQDAVREGRLDVRLGRMLDPMAKPKLTPELERFLVLNPEPSGERS